MNHLKSTILAGFGFGLASLNSSVAHAQCPTEEAIFLFDESGSMNDPGSTNAPKWQIARDKALLDYGNLASNTQVSIIGFGNTDIGGPDYYHPFVTFSQNLVKNSTNDAALRAQLNSAAVPGNFWTPFAGGSCDALLEIWTANPNCISPQPRRQLYVYSDGIENSTPTTNACYSAINSTTAFNPALAGSGFGLQDGSWQRKVANMAYNGNPDLDFVDLPTEFRPVVSVTLLFDFVNHLAGSAPGRVDGGPTLNANLQQNVDANGVAFFQGLTQVSFGQYFEAKIVNGVATKLPITGDTDPTPTRSCVDSADLNRVSQALGHTVRNNDPQFSGEDLARRDVNNDLVINTLDYVLVVQNFGRCG